MRIFKRRFPLVKQYDIKDCGPACLAMVCRHYGLILSISSIRNLAGTDRQGTTLQGMLEAAQRLGFEAQGVKVTSDQALENIPLPAIAHVVTEEGRTHYVVMYKVGKGKIWVADPDKGLRVLSREAFGVLWTKVLLVLQPGPEFQPGRRATSTLRRFMILLRPQIKLLIPLFFLSVFFNLFGLLGAFYFKLLIDDIIPNHAVHMLQMVSLGIIVLYVFKVILSYLRNQIILHFSRRIDISLMLGYYRHVVGLAINFFETRKVGEIVSRMMDAGKVRDALSTSLVTLMIDTLMVIMGSVLLYLQSPVLFGVTAALVPFYAAVVWLFHKPYETVNHLEMENSAKLTSYMVESLHGIHTVKSYNAESEVVRETEQRFMGMLDQVFRLGKLTNLQGSLKMGLELIGGLVILWIGAYQVLKGELTLGQLITFNALLGYFLEPIENLIQLQPEMQSAVVAAERLNDILDLPAEREGQGEQVAPRHLKSPIEMSQVSFRYGAREKVLDQVSFTIQPGMQAAFVGESGSGKTTIAKLLMRFYAPQEGKIYLGDTPLDKIDRDYLRSRIAYVPQESFFFSGTIYQNLCFGLKREVPLEEVVEAAKLAQAHDFISKLPMQYETVLEENGANLSGGQKQRLAIARALLKRPDIFIFDESTSQLDSVTERAVVDMLADVCRRDGVTVIMIAHRLSTIRHADAIFVLKEGRLVEQGSHGQLLQQRGEYYRLWQNQSLLMEGLGT